MKLTNTQKIAVETTTTDILVSAGAGAGKTRVLVERFLHFVISGKARVTEILTLTFTDKAANEMKDRIMKRFRDENMLQARRDLELAYISTIHSFCSRILKEHPIEANISPDFSVMESEEAELLQDLALDEIIETQCVAGSDVFELLKIYGENDIREGIKKVLAAARIEGLNLKQFFERQIASVAVLPRNDSISPSVIARRPQADEAISALFDKVKEPGLFKDYSAFSKNPQWDWKTVEAFREWSSGFNRRGGKETKVYWKEINAACAQLLAARLDQLSQPWRGKFEKFALDFEAAYEKLKFERGVLDFDDLQIKALELLTAEKPANKKLLEYYRSAFKYILVDEYQDVNPLQVKLIECFNSVNVIPAQAGIHKSVDSSFSAKGGPASGWRGNDRGGKMFYVGDYKQSIYGFRGTSPQHFLEKQREYRKAQKGLLIEMLENFRTQKPVLHFVNSFFERIWQEDQLENTGLIAAAETESEKMPELLVIHKKEEESIEQARMREAGALAQKIRELHDQNIPYGQMAILFQALTSAGIYEHALKAAGIPYFVVAGRGFYHQPEIRDMMSLLSALENPLLDIPLAAALRSPLFRITDDTLFWLSRQAKKENEDMPLYEALKNLDKISEIETSQRQSLENFKKFFADLIEVKDRFYLSELLEWILRHTAYELSVLADRQGVRRYANLRKLINLARNEETHERMSLGDFIRLVHNLEAREIRESEAQVEAEQSGRVVRLMTIHAAKGLEFPICFVADLAYQSRNQNFRTFLAESGAGYGFKVFNPETRVMEEPGFYQVIDAAIEKRETQEWKRLFYVAATRAKQQLILSGVWNPPSKEANSFSKMSSWMEWLMHGKEDLPIEIQEIAEDAKGLVRASLKVFAEEENFQKILRQETKLEKILTDVKERAALAAETELIYRRLESHEAPAGRVIDLPVSAYCAFAKNPLEYWRVYEMGYASSNLDFETNYFDSEEEDRASAADFGTCIHKLLEIIDLQEPHKNLGDKMAQIFRGYTEKEIVEAQKIIQDFLNSSIFKKLQSAKKVYRELGFVLNERHGRIDGVIDLLFQDETGDWHILDYKTAVGDAQKVKDSAYDLQMGIYAAAVQEILKVAPKTAMLYFLKNQWCEIISLTPAVVAKTLEQIRAMQEDLLAFRMARTS